MTKIIKAAHYALHAGDSNVNTEHKHVLNRRFEDITTLFLFAVVAAPIAFIVAMVLRDWWMAGLGLAILMSSGIGSLYLLRVIREQTTGR